ncbi:rod shape-determining protein MreC [Candidatus Wolfebacteria bacterium]|nr:rod shape-determining protein MreC [Candidatus Wolfebacteria bacterium]
MKKYVFLFVIVILVFLTYFTDFFISKKRSFDENLALKQENQELRAQIQKNSILNSGSGFLNSGANKNLKARVFSVYPFNIKNQLTIDVGESRGVKKSMAVTLGENILVGQTKEVFADSSVVQTIFDPKMQLSVRIGEGQVDGLLQGGNEPKIILVEKTKPISVGDFVFSANADIPYGLKVGEIYKINENSAGVFKEIILNIPFSINELREVNVVK